MLVNEIFSSIQGEGAYAGYPVLFIRLSGCTRKCKFCDTQYHNNGKEINNSVIINKIKNSGKNIVVWTGGEPMLQIKDIKDIISSPCLQKLNIQHHLETNGDLPLEDNKLFNYVCFSPKEERALNNCIDYQGKSDIKIVTDCKNINVDMLDYATILMPLTTKTEEKNINIERMVWRWCEKHNKRFCLRQHIKVWGINKREI